MAPLSRVIGHAGVLPRLLPVLGAGGGAYLFHGPPSVGKRTTAVEMCRALLCRDGCADDACGCPSCVRFGADGAGHPDLLCVGRMSKTLVADVEGVLRFAETAPMISRRKVVVVDNAHDVTWEAANRLLKTMEEPPAGMFFFLVTSEPGQLLPTIKSRCVSYEFGALPAEDVTNILWKRLGFDLPKARTLGWIAGASPVDVFARAGQVLKYRDMAVELMATMKGRAVVDCLDYVDKVDKADLAMFIDMLVVVLTDILLLSGGVPGAVTNVDARESLQKAAASFRQNAIVYAVTAVSQAKKYAYLNANLNLALKVALIKAVPALNQ